MGEEEANDLPFKINKLAMAFQMLRNKPYGLVDFLQIWSMLDLGHNPNDKDDLGWPPIVYAAFGGHIHVTRLLLHYKANVNANNRFNETALSTACRKRNYALISLLLKHGADSSIVDMSSFSALRWAAKYGDLRMLRRLIKANCSVTKDSAGQTLNAISIAESHGHLKFANALRERLVFERKTYLETLAYLEEENRRKDSEAIARAKRLRAEANAERRRRKRLNHLEKTYQARQNSELELHAAEELSYLLRQTQPRAFEDGKKPSWVKQGRGKWKCEFEKPPGRRKSVDLEKLREIVTKTDDVECDWSCNTLAGRDTRWQMVFHSLKNQQ